MVDWLVIWGIAQGVGVLVYPIIQDLAKEGAKDFAKDFFKDSLKHVLLREKDPRQVAAGKAIKEFLQLMQQQLKFRHKLSDAQIKQYIQEVKTFINKKPVKEILGKGFDADCDSLDASTLKNTWDSLQLRALPPNFNWEGVTEQYLLKVQEILWESEDLRSILDSQNLASIEKQTQEIAGIIPELNLQQYQETIRERYGNLKLDSLDTSGYAYNELKLWRLFIAQNVRKVHQVLPQVHELPKEHLRRLRESEQLEAEIALEELERHKRDYFEQPIRSVLDIVNNKQTDKYIVILGDPGSGKSTLLQYLALNWAESPLVNVISLPIPLLIELRTYMRRRDDKDCHNFLEFFHKCSGAIAHLNQHQLHEQLKAGNALVMFDGLDEVFEPGKREDVITDIHRFTNDYPNVQVIVTSRVIGYKPQRLRDAEFRHFMLQDLEPEQIQDFINRWHELTFNDAADKERKKQRLQRAINDSKAIAELAGNALLLTMMAILNRNQELPRDRAELYNQTSRVLLHQWDVERALVEDKRLDPKTIDYKDKQAMLRQVAYHMQTSDKGLAGNLISAADLEKILIGYLKTIEVSQAREVAKLMINQLRTRNFMLCFLGADYYAFVHRTFLEYFCAWEFVWQFEKERTITLEYLQTEVFGKHWQDETWHEVLRLIAGMIEPKFVSEILDYLMKQNGEGEKFINLFLAAKCLAEVRNRSVMVSTANKLLNQLKDLTKYDLWYYYSYRDEEEIKLVQEIRTQAVTAIATTWQESPDTKTWLKQRASEDEDFDVRSAAVQQLATAFKDDPDTKTWLKQRACEDDDWRVRRAAVQQLATAFKDDPDTKTILKQRACEDDNSRMRGAAVQQLATAFKDDPDTKTILKQRASEDESSSVRRAAVQALATAFKDDPDTKTILKQRASEDEHSDVRYAAVQQLATAFKDDPDTKTILKQRASEDEHSDVRGAAVQQLATAFKDDPDTKIILKQRASEDEHSDVRGAAVQQLATAFKDDPDTKTILKQRASEDEHSDVRGAAVQQLATAFKDDPDTKIILKQRASEDESSSVRGAAVQQLAKAFKDDLGMFDVFYNCAVSDRFEGSHEEIVNPNPRYIALDIIIKQYPEHPQTLPLLRDKAENDPDEEVRKFAQKKLAKLEGVDKKPGD